MNLRRLFPTLCEIRDGLLKTGPLFLFRTDAADELEATIPAALRSFSVYWLTLPFGVASGWIFDRIYIAAYGVDKPLYFAYAVMGAILSALFSIFLTFAITRMEGLQANYPRYVVAMNWSSLWVVAVSVPLIALVQSGLLNKEQIAELGTGIFLVNLVYAWFFAWQALKVNPLVAMGVATASMAPATVVGDFVGLRLYGVARPFFE